MARYISEGCDDETLQSVRTFMLAVKLWHSSRQTGLQRIAEQINQLTSSASRCRHMSRFVLTICWTVRAQYQFIRKRHATGSGKAR